MKNVNKQVLKEDKERQKVLKLLADTNKAIYNKKMAIKAVSTNTDIINSGMFNVSHNMVTALMTRDI
jgi:hypothetical protein